MTSVAKPFRWLFIFPNLFLNLLKQKKNVIFPYFANCHFIYLFFLESTILFLTTLRIKDNLPRVFPALWKLLKSKRIYGPPIRKINSKIAMNKFLNAQGKVRSKSDEPCLEKGNSRDFSSSYFNYH